ncbi:hypothetical protein DPEC_G00291360 [Dallia pectoralis]|uniref:Uncharacterized protein n=1 Tax=Dallia pectoralis TaxID=75939 RepID=A0ACC2FHS5_DALPE|nr:hypothetical protein DPEC_G00291360 [Dallia pectoralis]
MQATSSCGMLFITHVHAWHMQVKSASCAPPWTIQQKSIAAQRQPTGLCYIAARQSSRNAEEAEEAVKLKEVDDAERIKVGSALYESKRKVEKESALDLNSPLTKRRPGVLPRREGDAERKGEDVIWRNV